MRGFFFVLLLVFSTVRAEPLRTDASGNPLLDQFSEGDFVDCVFRISNLVETTTHYRFHVAAAYKEETVGMDVAVVKGIQAAFDSGMKVSADRVYRKGVAFYRSGPESDRLISALAMLYSGTPRRLTMNREESFTAIALHQGSVNMDREPIKLKIFGRDGKSDREDEYYESFFNVDLRNGLVFWNEKDQEYRAPLVKALSAPAPK